MSAHRPILSISRTKTEWIHDVLSIVCLLFSFGYLAYVWSKLPPTIAIHFDSSGEPDGWGSKIILIVLPIISLILYGALTWLRKIPHHFNYPIEINEHNASRAYQLTILLLSWIKLEMVLMFGYMQWGTVQSALVRTSELSVWFLLSVIVIIMGTIGVCLVRLLRIK